MIVSGLDDDGDWRFGKGRASYLRRSNAIRQNVATRLRSFLDDWFLDIQAGNPWIDLMGSKNTRDQILQTVERTVISTLGVREILSLELLSIDANRGAKIQLRITDIFDEQISMGVQITL